MIDELKQQRSTTEAALIDKQTKTKYSVQLKSKVKAQLKSNQKSNVISLMMTAPSTSM